MSSSSEYEDVDMDSSGSESDIESGDRQFNTKTPSKKEQEKAKKTPARKPPVDTAGFDGIKLSHFIIIRCVQCFLACASFSFMGSSETWKDVKNTTKTTTTCYTTLDVGENATVKSEEFTLQGLCSTDGDDMVGSCYRMIVASNFLLAVGILYWIYLGILVAIQLIMYCSIYDRCPRVTNKKLIILRDETFLKTQIVTDLCWLFATIISLCVGGTSGDANWRWAVGVMVIIVFTEILSLMFGVNLYTKEILIGKNIINDVQVPSGKKSKKKRVDDEIEEEKGEDITASKKSNSGKKKKKTISQVQKERGIIKQQSTPLPNTASKKSNKKSRRSKKSDAASKANLRAIHDFPGANSAAGFRPERDLAFKSGDLLIKFEEIHNGEWYYGCDMDGNKGEFPKNRTEPYQSDEIDPYIKNVVNAPQSQPNMPPLPPSHDDFESDESDIDG